MAALKPLMATALRRAGRVANTDLSERVADLEKATLAKLALSRATIAQHYLKGRGLEIGALHRPLLVPPGATVDYVDVAPADVLRARFPEVGEFRPPDIIDNGETLTKIADRTYDFVVANHFLEHTEDPFATLQTFVRVLRPGGMIFMAIPDKRWTFDAHRAITPASHLLRDHREGPETSRRDHYEEWLRVIDGLAGGELESRLAAFIADRVNIHFHVWTIREMAEMFAVAREELAIPIEIQMAFADRSALEVIWVLRVQ